MKVPFWKIAVKPWWWERTRHNSTVALFAASLIWAKAQAVSSVIAFASISENLNKVVPEEAMKQTNKKIVQHFEISALLFVAKHSYKSFPIISCCCYQMNSRSSGLSINFKNYMWREYINSVFVSLLNLSANKLLYH